MRYVSVMCKCKLCECDVCGMVCGEYVCASCGVECMIRCVVYVCVCGVAVCVNMLCAFSVCVWGRDMCVWLMKTAG